MSARNSHDRRGQRESIIKRVCFVLIWVLVTAGVAYRAISWFLRYQSLASKMIVSSSDDEAQDIPFPYITLCSLNPARGTALFAFEPRNSTDIQDYELFVDAISGNKNWNASRRRLSRPLYNLIDNVSHQLSDMLKSCLVGNVRCSYKNFTKSLLPNGACYTLDVKVNAYEDVSLVLDPEGFDYLIPNEHFVGFRVLLHSRGDPLWARLPSAVYIGPKFQTVVRAIGMKKIFTRDCLPQMEWAKCLHRCMEDSLYRRCRCKMLGSHGCTLQKMMKCGLRMDEMIEALSVSRCPCEKPCDSYSYSIESVTQALKSTLFSRLATIHSVPSQSEIKRLESGEMIQTWAYLREANRTAFEKLRILAKYQEELYKHLKRVQSTVNNIYNMWPRNSFGGMENEQCSSSVEQGRMIDKVRKLGNTVYRRFVKSFLYKDYESVPQNNMHIHIVNLFFDEIESKFDMLGKNMPFNDLVSDVTMLDHRRPTDSCALNRPGYNENTFRTYIDNLQTLLSKTDSTFNYFKKAFIKLVKDNAEIRSQMPNKNEKLIPMRPSSEENDRLVTLTIRLSQNKNRPLRLESIQILFDPKMEIMDLIFSGVILAFLLMLMVQICSKKKCSNNSYRPPSITVNKPHPGVGSERETFFQIIKRRATGNGLSAKNPELLETLTVL